MKHLFFVLCSLVLLTSCDPVEAGYRKEKPENLIGKDKMTQMLIDVHLIEGSRSGLRVLGDSVSVDVYYKSLFDKYDVTQAQYDSSFRYYSHYPAQMMDIYDVVIDSLKVREIHVEDRTKHNSSAIESATEAFSDVDED